MQLRGKSFFLRMAYKFSVVREDGQNREITSTCQMDCDAQFFSRSFTKVEFKNFVEGLNFGF